MSETPPTYDSRAWTGDITSGQPPRRPLPSLSRISAFLLTLLGMFVIFEIVDAGIWYGVGEPTMFEHSTTNHTLGLSALAGIAVAFLFRKRVPEKYILSTGGLGFGVALILVHEFCFLDDLAHAQPIGRGTAFVEAVRLPHWFGRRRKVTRPTAELRGPGWMSDLIGPKQDIAGLVPRDSCVDLEVTRGPHGATFVKMRTHSSGDGTGSWMVADENRARCLGG